MEASMSAKTTGEVREAETRLNPGDEAAPGTPGTGEAVCPICEGSGRARGAPCKNCGGSGKIIKAVGGA
jgi:DnaJ-class molecular chaperone